MVSFIEKEKSSDYLSYNNTICLKGFFALCVLLHHVYQYSGLFRGSILGTIFQALGYLSVGMFFFYTGYGMMLSKNKNGYIKMIGKKRILPLYMFYVFLIIFYGGLQVVLGVPISLPKLLQSFLFGATIVPLGWYLQVIFVIYFILWMIFVLIKNEKVCLVSMGGVLIAYCIICNLIGLSSTWYESIFCTLLGMFWFAYKDVIDKMLEKIQWGGSAFLCSICSIFYCFVGFNNILHRNKDTFNDSFCSIFYFFNICISKHIL